MKILFVLFVLFALCSCKLTLKPKAVGRGIAEETTLLKIEYRGSCADFSLVAPSVTVNAIDYTAAALTNPATAPASPQAGCLPFFLEANGAPRDYDNLNGHYVCTNVARNRAVIDVVEVFNPTPGTTTLTTTTDDTAAPGGNGDATSADAAACAANCLADTTCVAWSFTPTDTPACTRFTSSITYTPASAIGSSTGTVDRASPIAINEDATVSYILGIASNKPFRTLGATALRRPSCTLSRRLCAASATSFDVRSCSSNTPTYKRGWILNQDLVYLVPNVYSANNPADCRVGTTCCSYLPGNAAINAGYLANTASAFCIAPTDTRLFSLEPRHDDHYGDKRTAQ